MIALFLQTILTISAQTAEIQMIQDLHQVPRCEVIDENQTVECQ